MAIIGILFTVEKQIKFGQGVPFWDRRGAGACIEFETVRVVVRDQLARIESLTFLLVRMG